MVAIEAPYRNHRSFMCAFIVGRTHNDIISVVGFLYQIKRFLKLLLSSMQVFNLFVDLKMRFLVQNFVK